MPPFRSTPRLARSMPELFSAVRAQHHPQVVHVQRVRFRTPFRLRNLFIGLGVSFLAINVYDAIVIGPLARATEKAAQGMSREQIEELDDTPIFIPFPFTEKEVRPPPFAGKDPEWLKFCEISRDPALRKTIQHELASYCLSAAKKTPSLVRKMGPDITIDHAWLIIQYPMYPPPELRRKGIEISDDGIVWVEKKVDLSTIQRVQRVLWPTPLAVSMWHFSWSLFKQNLQDAARIFGFSSSPSEPAAERAIAQAVETMVRAQNSKRNKPPTVSEPGGMPPANRQTDNGPVTDDPNKPVPLSARQKTSAPTQPPQPPGTSKNGHEEGDEKDKLRPQDLYPYETIRQRIKGSWAEFFKAWNLRWRKVRDHPPRGSVIVSGMVQLKSSNGWAVVDCTGCWDPKTRDYVADNIFMRLRMYIPAKQRPLRE